MPPLTANVWTRVFFLKVGSNAGTAFTVERGGKQYLVTAKHLVSGLPSRDAAIQIFKDQSWDDHIVSIVYPQNPDVDMAVLTSRKAFPGTLELEPTMEGIMLSQDVFFLGFPHGMTTVSVWGGYPLPLVKRGIISALDYKDKSRIIIYVDGFNNPGFSGGPIVFSVGNTNKFRIAGVVSGYRYEKDKVYMGPNITDYAVLSNTGILIGHSIQHAVEVMDTLTGPS